MIERYELSIRLTPNQNILLCDIQPEWKADIDSVLRGAGILPPAEVDTLDRFSMACPALPLCGLAIGEAERGMPDVNRRVRDMLVKVGLPEETVMMRMTGCPNGCDPLHPCRSSHCLVSLLRQLARPLGVTQGRAEGRFESNASDLMAMTHLSAA